MTRRKFLHRSGTAAALLCEAAWSPARTPDDKPPQQVATIPGAMHAFATRELAVQVGERTIQTRLLSPERLAPRPMLLLSLTSDRHTALQVQPYCIGAMTFVAAGHRALSFDLPNHGERVDNHGEGIRGWRNAWVDGTNPFAAFLEEASAVITRCLQEGWTEAGRVVAYGVSRGGYLALRLLAHDSRVGAAAAIAPVTDWRDLTEFAAERTREDLGDLRLSQYAAALAGKRVFLVIGNADDRVSTRSCSRLFIDLLEANARRGQTSFPGEFHCAAMSEPGHVVDDSWRQAAAEFLLKEPL
jgi:dienelactone hydrolase